MRQEGNLRTREITIGNTAYTVIAKEKSDAKETAFDITKRLLRSNISTFVEQLQTDSNQYDSLKGCDSGGKK